MKTRFLRDKEGKVDKRYAIAKDGSYIRDKIIGKKLTPYIHNGYRVISIKINGNNYNQVKISRLQRMAWKGIIPKGYILHHKKFSKNKKINKKLKLNDHIDNLDCLSESEHRSLHTTGKNHYLFGRHPSEEALEKMSIAKSGENHPMYGKYHSEKALEKMSIVKFGENNPMHGKHHSEKALKKMSIAKSGENNPMYGVRNFGENNYNAILTKKKVKKIRILSYIRYWIPRKIADKFKVSIGCITGILQGHNWNPDKLTRDQLIQQTIKENKK